MAKGRGKGKRGRPDKPPPVCKAILLCDTVIQDAFTGKVSLIGLFEGFILRSMPGVTVPVIAFLQLIEGIGQYSLKVEVHDLANDKVIARAPPSAVNFPDRLARKQIIIPVPPLPMEHEGAYDFVVTADGKEVDRQQFKVVVKEEPNEPPKDPPSNPT
jgi:hypothetical protein